MTLTVFSRVIALSLLCLASSGPGRLAQAETLDLCRKGWSASQNDEIPQALALYQQCIATGNLTQASLARAWRNMGIAYRSAGQFDKAVDAYTRAIQLRPDDVINDYVNRANAYDDAGKKDLALKDYTQAITLNPKEPGAYYNRGIWFERQLNFAAAKADFLFAHKLGLRSDLLRERFEVYGLAWSD